MTNLKENISCFYDSEEGYKAEELAKLDAKGKKELLQYGLISSFIKKQKNKDQIIFSEEINLQIFANIQSAISKELIEKSIVSDIQEHKLKETVVSKNKNKKYYFVLPIIALIGFIITMFSIQFKTSSVLVADNNSGSNFSVNTNNIPMTMSSSNLDTSSTNNDIALNASDDNNENSSYFRIPTTPYTKNVSLIINNNYEENNNLSTQLNEFSKKNFLQIINNYEINKRLLNFN